MTPKPEPKGNSCGFLVVIFVLVGGAVFVTLTLFDELLR